MKNSPIISVLNSKTEELITERTFVDKISKEERSLFVVQVQQTVATIANNRVNASKRVAFVTLDEDSLEMLEDEIVEGAVFPLTGKLVVLESLTKAWETQKPKINPNTNELIKYQGQLIYRSVNFTSDVNAHDILLRDSDVPEMKVPESTPQDTF